MPERKPVAELIADYRPGWSLEQAFYTDPRIYRLEMERIFMRRWIFAGHASQIPEPGDWLLFELAQESVIIVRGNDGEIRGFHNVCRHRGSRICLQSQGHSNRFLCPYHAWAYDLDGRLLAAREMPDDFSRSDFALHTARVQTLFGLILVCLGDEPPSLAAARRDLAEPLEIFGVADLRVAAHRSYPIASNWKLAVENYHECYHCAPAHPEYARMHTLKLDERRRAKLQGSMRQRMPACGLREITHDFQDKQARAGEEGYSYSRTALFEGYQTGSPTGAPLAPLLGKLTGYDGGASDFNVGPVSFFLAYSDHVVGYVFTPVSQQQCNCDIYWMVRGDAEEGIDYKLDELAWLWDVTTLADERIIVNNQKGVNSHYYRPGPLSEMENFTRRFLDWLLMEIQDGAADDV